MKVRVFRVEVEKNDETVGLSYYSTIKVCAERDEWLVGARTNYSPEGWSIEAADDDFKNDVKEMIAENVGSSEDFAKCSAMLGVPWTQLVRDPIGLLCVQAHHMDNVPELYAEVLGEASVEMVREFADEHRGDESWTRMVKHLGRTLNLDIEGL